MANRNVLRLCKLSFILYMTAMMFKSLRKMEVTIIRAILYHFYEITLVFTQLKMKYPKTREILDFLFLVFCYG